MKVFNLSSAERILQTDGNFGSYRKILHFFNCTNCDIQFFQLLPVERYFNQVGKVFGETFPLSVRP